MHLPHNLKVATLMAFAIVLNATSHAQEQSPYRLKGIEVPLEVRPPVKYTLDQLSFSAYGVLSTYDGEYFQINFNSRQVNTMETAQQVVAALLSSLKSPLTVGRDLRLRKPVVMANPDMNYINEQIKLEREKTRHRIQGQVKVVGKSTDEVLDELDTDIRQQAEVKTTLFLFEQYFGETLIDGSAIAAVGRGEKRLASLIGKFYNVIKSGNQPILTEVQALVIAVAQLKKDNKTENLEPIPGKGELVLLPYGETFLYTWKAEVMAEGRYRVWIDAQNGKLLMIQPLFFFDNAKGLAFNPDPIAGAKELTFDVDPARNGIFTLRLTDVIEVINEGADGSTGVVTVPASGPGADFNVAPINGTVVERTSQPGYNGKFQQVNAYAHVFNERRWYQRLGSQPFPPITIRVSTGDACEGGPDGACSTIALGIGSATLSANTNCESMFNSAIDATVIAHEFGHQLNGIQYGMGMVAADGNVHEGMADFWAETNFNTDIFGGWFGKNCPPVQTGWAPRQAEPLDIFPDHTINYGGQNEGHSSGQIIAWANWSARQGMNDATTLGPMSLSMNIIEGMSTAGIGIDHVQDPTFRTIHDSYVNLLQQMLPLYKNSRLVHKLLAGYARAGIYLDKRAAIIDIDHSYLDRSNAQGPVFSIWTGKDYLINGNQVDTHPPVMPYNKEFLVEVANDEGFAVNLVSSGWQGGVVSGAGGQAQWQLPQNYWSTLKAGNDIYYKVTTRDPTGELRSSLHPGNNFMGDVPAGRAAINGTGTKDCSCSASASPMASLLTMLPLLALVWFRKARTYKPE